MTIALDPTIARPQPLLEAIGEVLREAGVEPADLTVLAPSAVRGSLRAEEALAGATIAIHDSRDRGQLAYLAATKQGRRIYLNRLLTDADVVIPVGRLGYDPIMGYRGPWSVLFPELSERAAIETHRGLFRDEIGEQTTARAGASLDESFEVSWLLGSQFFVGVVPGSGGMSGVVCGKETAVRERRDRHGRFLLGVHGRLSRRACGGGDRRARDAGNVGRARGGPGIGVSACSARR